MNIDVTEEAAALRAEQGIVWLRPDRAAVRQIAAELGCRVRFTKSNIVLTPAERITSHEQCMRIYDAFGRVWGYPPHGGYSGCGCHKRPPRATDVWIDISTPFYEPPVDEATATWSLYQRAAALLTTEITPTFRRHYTEAWETYRRAVGEASRLRAYRERVGFLERPTPAGPGLHLIRETGTDG